MTGEITQEEDHMTDRYDPIEVHVDVVEHTTDKALLCDVGQPKPIWIPRSAILEEDGADITKEASKGDEGTLFIPRWLAEEKELV